MYKIEDGSPSSSLFLCKASKMWALEDEAGKKQPGLNRKRGGGSILERCFEGWEIAQQLRVLTAHPEDQDLILNTHIVAHSYLRYETLFCLLGNQACTWCTDVHASRNPIDIITFFLKKKAFWARHSCTQLIPKDPNFKANLGNLFLFFLLQ